MKYIIAGNRRRQHGFTLVEVLSAALILSIGLLAIVSAMQASRKSQQSAVYMNIAMNAAQSQIEGIRSLNWNNIADPPDTTVPALPFGNVLSVTVNKYPNAQENKLYKIIVAVTWPEGSGTRSWTYETLRTKYN